MQQLSRELYGYEILMNHPFSDKSTLIWLDELLHEGRETSSQHLSEELGKTMDEANRAVITDL